MALKDNWTDKVNGVDTVDAKDINAIARSIIDLENARNNGELDGVHIGTDEPTDNSVLWIDEDEEGAVSRDNTLTASVGQTIIVKEIDENGKPTKWKAVETGYHYFDTVDLLPEQTLPEAGLDGKNLTIESVPLLGLIEGETYTYTFDGATYTSVAAKFENLPWGDELVSGVAIGNFGIYDALLGTSFGNNGQPVIFADVYNYGVCLFVPAVYGAYTASVNGKKEFLKKLDPHVVPYTYYIDVVCETFSDVTAPNVYTCTETVDNVMAIIKSGREVKLRVRFTGNNALPLLMEYSRHIYSEFFEFMGFFAAGESKGSGVQLLFLISQEDGTFIVEETLG